MSDKSAMQYSRDGRPIVNPSVNSLSGFAYFYTKGIDEKDRISVARLEELLAEAGMTDDPRDSDFEVTLPNGRVIKGERVTSVTKRAKATPSTAPKPAVKKATAPKSTAKRTAEVQPITKASQTRRASKATARKAS